MLRVYKVAEGASAPHPLAVAEVASVLRRGGLALLPTETVYGIGVSIAAFAQQAPTGSKTKSATASASGATTETFATTPNISQELDPELLVNGTPTPGPHTGYGRIFTLKQRSLKQTVPWLVDGPQALDEYGAEVPQSIRILAQKFWPGALTLVVKAAPNVPAFMQAADGTVALRASASPVIQALVKACKSPLAVTSANTHGAPAPAAFAQAEPRILDGVDVAVDAGATPCRDASTIVSCAPDGSLNIIRQGALPAEDLYAALREAPAAGPSSPNNTQSPASRPESSAHKAPGMLP